MTGDVDELTRLVERVVAGAAALRAADLPPEVLDHVGLVVADTVGRDRRRCTLARGLRSAR